MAASGPLLSRLGTNLDQLEANLEPTWGILEPTWSRLGPFFPLLTQLGAILNPKNIEKSMMFIDFHIF